VRTSNRTSFVKTQPDCRLGFFCAQVPPHSQSQFEKAGKHFYLSPSSTGYEEFPSAQIEGCESGRQDETFSHAKHAWRHGRAKYNAVQLRKNESEASILPPQAKSIF